MNSCNRFIDNFDDVFRHKMDLKENCKTFIYLDYNATTPLAEEVVTGISSSLISDWGNPSSGNPYGIRAKESIAKARKQLADMLNCSSEEVIFTSGGTEANNMVINSVAPYFRQWKCLNDNLLNEKPHIITTNVEHDSVVLPIKHLEEESIVNTSIVEVNEKGCVNVEDVIQCIKPQTCLITIMYANNETGVIMPVSEIAKELLHINEKRKKVNLPKILFHTDAAQIIGKEKISFHDLNVDFMTVVGHKFYGPRIGCLCRKTKIFPLLFGGGQENGLRPGTENTPMIIGLGIAAELVVENIEMYKTHMLECRDFLETKLKEIFGNEIVINCRNSSRLPNTCNVSFKGFGLEGSLILNHCDSLIASVGAACHGGKCSQILINSGVPVELAKNSIRLSVGRKTTLKNIEEAVLQLENAVAKVKGFSKVFPDSSKLLSF